jgi:putative spermidine/putrescine transport system substrate-binding protein
LTDAPTIQLFQKEKRRMKKSGFKLTAILIILTIALGACAPAATPVPEPTQPPAPPPTQAPAPTQPPAPTQAPATQAPAAPTQAPSAPTQAPAAPAAIPDALIKAAQAEGQLTVIALPHDWLNYGEMISTFSQKYNIKVNELDPNAASATEIEAIKANKDNKGPQAPDVIDVGLSLGPSAKADGLIQPYKVTTWDSIPATVKDPDGYWYGDYYGALAFEINANVVKTEPKDWKDLLNPEYNGQVALAGDPRISNQAILSVMAASIANGGSADDMMPGMKFFADLNKAGNFVPVIAKYAGLAKGETPIVIRWDYLALADRDTSKDNPKVDVVIPASGVVAGVYIQAISAYAPHPNAAKLWMEYLYSDEGQLIWLKGYGHPIRYDDLAKRNVIPADLAAKLPPAASYASVVFPTLDQQNAAAKSIADNWDKIVSVNVK